MLENNMEKLNNMEGGKIQCTEKSFYLRFDIIFPRVEGDNALGYLHKDNKDISNLVTNLENFILMFAFKIVHFGWSATHINFGLFLKRKFKLQDWVKNLLKEKLK